jgi:hypothetical protein
MMIVPLNAWRTHHYIKKQKKHQSTRHEKHTTWVFGTCWLVLSQALSPKP